MLGADPISWSELASCTVDAVPYCWLIIRGTDVTATSFLKPTGSSKSSACYQSSFSHRGARSELQHIFVYEASDTRSRHEIMFFRRQCLLSDRKCVEETFLLFEFLFSFIKLPSVLGTIRTPLVAYQIKLATKNKTKFSFLKFCVGLRCSI